MNNQGAVNHHIITVFSQVGRGERSVAVCVR